MSRFDQVKDAFSVQFAHRRKFVGTSQWPMSSNRTRLIDGGALLLWTNGIP